MIVLLEFRILSTSLQPPIPSLPLPDNQCQKKPLQNNHHVILLAYLDGPSAESLLCLTKDLRDEEERITYDQDLTSQSQSQATGTCKVKYAKLILTLQNRLLDFSSFETKK